MGEFKRKPGETLGLSLDLRPDPGETRYVRAFFFDKAGAALAPNFINLTDNGGGSFSENTVVMQSIPQMRAKYRVFFDAAYTEEDDCEYLGGEDVFDLDELVATQLPPDSTVKGSVQGEVVVQGEVNDEKLKGNVGSEKLSGRVEDPEALEANEGDSSVSADVKSDTIKGKIDC